MPVVAAPPYPLSDALIAEMAVEFPGFAVRSKRDSRFHRMLHVLLMIITCGCARSYLTHYHTTLFGKVWTADEWAEMEDHDRCILLRHERVHLRQFKRLGTVLMIFLFLFPFFPVLFAYGRACLEWEAYVETIRAVAELEGMRAALHLKEEIIRCYTGPAYAWMWPYRGAVGKWFDQVIADIHKQQQQEQQLQQQAQTDKAISNHLDKPAHSPAAST